MMCLFLPSDGSGVATGALAPKPVNLERGYHRSA
jgi:hypothetical protein